MLLYFRLPLVRHYLPVDHFHYFAVLVTAITILLSEPTYTDVDMANMLLRYFVKEMEPLYGQLLCQCIFQSKFYNCPVGIRAMTMNTHSLSHLAKQVRDNGPLVEQFNVSV